MPPFYTSCTEALIFLISVSIVLILVYDGKTSSKNSFSAGISLYAAELHS
jgi:hypothetical protein